MKARGVKKEDTASKRTNEPFDPDEGLQGLDVLAPSDFLRKCWFFETKFELPDEAEFLAKGERKNTHRWRWSCRRGGCDAIGRSRMNLKLNEK